MCMLPHQSCLTLCDPMDYSRTPPTACHQALCTWGFSRQKYWSGLPCPPPGDLSDLGIELATLMSPVLAAKFFTTSTTSEAPRRISGLAKRENLVTHEIWASYPLHLLAPCLSVPISFYESDAVYTQIFETVDLTICSLRCPNSGHRQMVCEGQIECLLGPNSDIKSWFSSDEWFLAIAAWLWITPWSIFIPAKLLFRLVRESTHWTFIPFMFWHLLGHMN